MTASEPPPSDRTEPPASPPERPVPPEWTAAIERLMQVLDTLRGPGGCPWDAKQTVASLVPHLVEESHELADAAARGDRAGLREELGDLLMGVLMTARVAAEDDDGVDPGTVARAVTAKLIRRHPHVYGEVRVSDSGEVLRNWEDIKREERREEGKEDSVLGGVPASLPALTLARRVGDKAAAAGFDWPDLSGPVHKVEEELGELAAAAESGDRTAVEDELGDLLFAVVNVARKLGVDPETALRRTVARFRERFGYVERRLGERLRGASLEELEALWQEAKRTAAAAEPTGAEGRASDGGASQG